MSRRSNKIQLIPRNAQSRAIPAPVAPPPMIITSVEIGEKSPTSRYILGDNPIVTPKAKILIKRNVKTVTNSMAIVWESG